MVNLIHCKKKYLENQIRNRQFVCFGAGKQFTKFMKFWITEDNIDKLLCVVDSNLAGREVECAGKSIPVYNINQFIDQNQCDDFILIITNLYDCMEIVENLDQCIVFNARDCFIAYIIDGEYPEQLFRSKVNSPPRIDKTIHYCWFGRETIPKHLQKCINSWEKICPDYKIIRWDESNYDVTKNKYMKDAYDAKMWGFVSDYARLDVIYNYGGIYLDTDVELIRDLDDLRANDMFCGFENNHFVAFGLGYGAVKGHRIIGKLLDIYDKLVFDTSQGLPVACPVYQTKVLCEEGLKRNNTFQQIKDFTVYPSEVMAPISSCGMGSGITKNTVSIHHYDASWVKDRLRRKSKLENNKNSYFQRVTKVE